MGFFCGAPAQRTPPSTPVLSDLVAATVLKIVENQPPRLRYVIGRQARLVSRLRRFLPEAALEQGNITPIPRGSRHAGPPLFVGFHFKAFLRFRQRQVSSAQHNGSR